jgi:AraC-like DNA-binding protein
MDEVVATSPSELRKGPRGGGRERDKIVSHVIDVERAQTSPGQDEWPSSRSPIGPCFPRADAVRSSARAMFFPPQKGAARTMKSQEWVQVWHDEALDGLELHHATYLTHTFARHAHDYYVLGLIEAGVQSFAYRGVRQVTPAGDVFVIHPGEAHTGEAVSPGGYAYRTLYPSVPLLQRACAEIAGGEQGVPYFPSPVIHDEELASCLRQLHLVLTTGTTALEREARFLQLCALLLGRYAELRPPERVVGQERSAIQQVRDYLEEHCAEPVTLAELAKLVGFSPYYLHRVFEREVGLPPHAYLESVRMREAQRRLSCGEPIAQVAASLGFSDQSHLTRRFTRILGITPGQYQHSKMVQDKRAVRCVP